MEKTTLSNKDSIKKQCVLEEALLCTGCGECDRCDLDPSKACDNCCKCISLDEHTDFRSIIVSRSIGEEDSTDRET